MKNNFNGSNNNLYWTFHSLMYINSKITGWSNINLRKVNVKPYGCDNIYTNKGLVEDKLDQLLDQFNE